MKKLICCITAIGFFVPAIVYGAGFSDVSVTHPMYESIMYLADRDYVSGYEDGTFKPDRVVTRAEILKFALKAAEIDTVTSGELTFTDVPMDAWYYPLVLTASQKGIVSGYDDGTFQPDRVVTRAEGAKIILNALHVTLPEAYTGGLKDVTAEDWFAPYVEYIRTYSLMTLEADEFKPDVGLKRQDVAELVYHFIKAKEVLNAPTMPVVPWIIFVCIYGILALIAWHFVAKRQHSWVYVVLSPFALFYLIFKATAFTLPHSEDDEEMDIVTHRKQFAYFRRPRRLERELLRWLDYNVKPVFALFFVLLLWFMMIFIIITQINTIHYKTPYKLLAETYVNLDS